MPAASRKGDNHSCPAQDQVKPGTPAKLCGIISAKPPVMKPHVGGPITKGSPTVNINNKPAARCGDTTKCTPVDRTDIIVTGAAKININSQLAAMVGSKIYHDGQVIQGSPNVNYGAAMAGATFGDAAAATEACEKAAVNRKQGEKQGKDMNCGHETVRQLCIQRCQEKGIKLDDCEAYKYEEDEWYRRYLADEKMAEKHNQENKDLVNEIRERNDKKWKEIQDGHPVKEVNPEGADWTLKSKDKQGSWESRQGTTFKVGNPPKRLTIERLPKEVSTDKADELAKGGQTGSFPPTRQKMLKDWCDIESRPGANTTSGIGEDLAGGNQVVAVVDSNKLPGNSGGYSPHVVTVSQMEFDADGKLVRVTVNDTSHKEGCGRELTGEQFDHALDTQGRQTNVIVPPK